MNVEFFLVTGSSNPGLARKVGGSMTPSVHVHNGIERVFPDGETRVQIPVNVREKPVFLIQSTCPPNPDKAYVELFQLIDAARRASASKIVVVEPYKGYGRQERKDRPRTAIAGAMMPQILEFLGANRIITIDPHAEATEGSTRIPWDKLPGSYTLVPAIESLVLINPVIASPDNGGFRRAVLCSESLGIGRDVAVAIKERDQSGKSRIVDIIGNVRGRDVLFIDDMIDSGGTIADAADFAQLNGANSVYAAATHGIFSGDALARLRDSAIRQVLTTDTIPSTDAILAHPKIHIFSVASHLAKAIEYNMSGKSISEDLIR